MNELMPCPFCGNAKNLAMVNEKHDHSGGYFIACPECGASTIMRYAMGDDPKPLLIEAWNRRAALAAQPGAVGEPAKADALNTICKMLHSGEEVEGDDGLAMLVPMDLWNEAQEAIELLVGEDDATEAKPAQDAVDAELLDWLESQINEHGAIHLHDGNNPNGHGLGLRPGSLNRTLRDAIRAAISAKKGGA